MAIPPSVTKVTKEGVTFTSNVDATLYTIKELCRAALRDVSKFLRKEFRTSYYNHFKRHTGKGGSVLYSKVYSSENTQYPRVEMGVAHATKKKSVDGFYAFFQEVGSSKQPKLALFTKAAEGNVAEIVKIESQYLSALNDEAEALRLIDESEYEGSEEF